MAKVKPKIATMVELSEAIGISRPTLSRYFQDPSSVRSSTSQKIQKRLAEVDYVYNFMATRQNRKTTGLIGVIIPHYKDLFFASLLEAIERAVQGTAFTVMAQSSDGTAAGETQAVAKLRSMGADGAIIAPLGLESSTETLQLASEDISIVFADSRPAQSIDGADFVGTDNAQSVAAIVEYLCQTGKPPVYLGMPALNSNAAEREQAYRSTLTELGLNSAFVATEGIAPSWQFEAYGFEVMDAHFSHKRHINDTILCANDRIAIGAIRAANKHDLFSGDPNRDGRVRIAGHDDHPLSRYMSPAITTVAQDIEGIGESAVQLLLERIRKDRTGAPVSIYKKTDIQIRESA